MAVSFRILLLAGTLVSACVHNDGTYFDGKTADCYHGDSGACAAKAAECQGGDNYACMIVGAVYLGTAPSPFHDNARAARYFRIACDRGEQTGCERLVEADPSAKIGSRRRSRWSENDDDDSLEDRKALAPDRATRTKHKRLQGAATNPTRDGACSFATLMATARGGCTGEPIERHASCDCSNIGSETYPMFACTAQVELTCGEVP
jgi:hypothetical protein